MRNNTRFLSRVANYIELAQATSRDIVGDKFEKLSPLVQSLTFEEVLRQQAELMKEAGGDLGQDILADAHRIVKERRAKRRERFMGEKLARAKGFL